MNPLSTSAWAWPISNHVRHTSFVSSFPLIFHLLAEKDQFHFRPEPRINEYHSWWLLFFPVIESLSSYMIGTTSNINMMVVFNVVWDQVRQCILVDCSNGPHCLLSSASCSPYYQVPGSRKHFYARSKLKAAGRLQNGYDSWIRFYWRIHGYVFVDRYRCSIFHDAKINGDYLVDDWFAIVIAAKSDEVQS